MGANRKISASEIRELAKSKGVRKGGAIGTISQKEYHALISGGYKKTRKRTTPPHRHSVDFSFTYRVEETNDGFIIELEGKHISKNRYMSLGKRDQIRYKTSIKKAAEDFWLANRSMFRSMVPLNRSEIRFAFYEPRLRDHDAEAETIKPFQDTMTMLGIIKDDSREHLHPVRDREYCEQIKSPHYKAVAFLTKID